MLNETDGRGKAEIRRSVDRKLPLVIFSHPTMRPRRRRCEALDYHATWSRHATQARASRRGPPRLRDPAAPCRAPQSAVSPAWRDARTIASPPQACYSLDAHKAEGEQMRAFGLGCLAAVAAFLAAGCSVSDVERPPGENAPDGNASDGAAGGRDTERDVAVSDSSGGDTGAGATIVDASSDTGPDADVTIVDGGAESGPDATAADASADVNADGGENADATLSDAGTDGAADAGDGDARVDATVVDAGADGASDAGDASGTGADGAAVGYRLRQGSIGGVVTLEPGSPPVVYRVRQEKLTWSARVCAPNNMYCVRGGIQP